MLTLESHLDKPLLFASGNAQENRIFLVNSGGRHLYSLAPTTIVVRITRS